jgi:RNA polymerase sigma factor (sigma-70 family)
MKETNNQEDPPPTLDELRKKPRTGDESLSAWLYPIVMRRFGRGTWLSDYFSAGFNAATTDKYLTRGLAEAKTVKGFVNYITLVTRSRCIDMWRKQDRRLKKDAKAEESRQATEPEPDSALDSSADMHALLDEAAAFLTPREHELFALWRRGLKPRQIAVALRWQPCTVWTRLSELKKKLKDIINKLRDNPDRE